MLRRAAQCVIVVAIALRADASALAAARWRSDIDFLVSRLEKVHPNLYFQISRASFAAELTAIKGEVEALTDQEIAFRLQRAVAMIGDAHTQIDIRIAPNTFFPLRLQKFGDGLIVTRTTDDSRAACSLRLVAIDGMDVREAYERVSALISHENDAWLSVGVPQILLRAEVLSFLGIAMARDHARFTFQSGPALIDVDLEPVAAQVVAQTVYAAPAETATTPLYQRSPARNYWWIWDEERRLLYVKYNACAEDASRPFAAFAREVFAFAETHTIERFVVDIRNNEGGNSSVVQPLISGLKQRPSLKGRLYGIIGRETFSAGVTAALDLRDAGAILAGESTGGRPNMYGNVESFVLPASGLNVYHSTKYFRRITNADPVSLEPDVRIDTGVADFFFDRDPVLDFIAPPHGAEAPSPVQSGSGVRRRAVAPQLPPMRCR